MFAAYKGFVPETAGVSPNGDNSLDAFYLQIGLLRNVDNIHYTVTNLTTGEVLSEQDTEFLQKSYAGGVYAGSEAGDFDMSWFYAKGVNEDGDNTTRFIVIEKEGAQRQPIAAAPGQRLSMLFTVDHKPGRLARVIQIIGERGFNMETIKSRPLPHVQFEYYFYVQLVCPANAATDDCAKLVHELENVCRTVRILGVFDL